MKANLKNPYTTWSIVAAILAIFMLNTPFAVHPELVDKGPSWLGLDVSWQMTLNYALKEKWVWGKDIVYTYGPLGFLSTRIGWGIPAWLFFVFDVFLVANFFFVFRDFLLGIQEKFIAILIVVVTTLLLGTNHGSDLSWVLTVFIYYWMFKSYKEPRTFYFVMMAACIVLCFFVKLNAGLIGITFLGAHLLNLLVYKRIRLLKSLCIFASVLALIGVLAALLHVHLPGYIKGAFEIIKGYNDVMHIDEGNYSRSERSIGYLLLFTLLLLAIPLIYSFKQRKLSTLLFSLLVFAYIFLLRKQSIVRNDSQHYYEFFAYAPFVFLFGIVQLLDETYQKYMARAVLCFSLFALFMVAEYDNRQVDKNFEQRYLFWGNYWQQFGTFNTKQYQTQADKRHIPQHVLSLIGNKTIDVFPWDSEYILENKLNYSPRPVFQSFSAYTEKLGKYNYQHYIDKAPQVILYDYESIDGRYPFNDDLLVNFFICKNYTFADSFTSNERLRLVLQRHPSVTPLEMVVPKNAVAGINKPIPVDWVMMMQIDIEETFAGKMQAFFNTTSAVILKMTRANGSVVKYKVSKELLKSGIMVDRWVANTTDFYKYLDDKNTLDVIKEIELIADPDYYKETIKIKYINIK